MYSRVPPLTDSPGVPQQTTQATESTDAGTKPPEGVSERLWEKFQSLQKRRQDMTKRSTEKRIKNLQKQAMDRVEAEMTTEEERDVLRSHQVSLSESPGGADSGAKSLKGATKRKFESSASTADQTSVPEALPCTSSSTRWLDVKPFLTVNDHLKGVEKGRHGPKTKLEEDLDGAVGRGDFEKAEKLSDQLATREFGKKIADAIDAKKYLEDKQVREETAKAKKKKKLHWGFEHKQRWETKGNM